MLIRVSIVVLVILACASCTQKMICPAYQSAFIHDKPTQRETFVYYNENQNQSREIVASNSKTITLPARVDSIWSKSDGLKGPALPKERRVRKDRYLLLPEKTYRKAVKALATIPMKPVYPKLEVDSSTLAPDLVGAEMDSATLAAQTAKKKPAEDSVYVISKAKEKFNLDQDNYMWYFRQILVLPDVRIAMQGSKENKAVAGEKAKGGFFKNLFKKKVKSKTPLAEVAPSNDSTSVTLPKTKKGVGGLFKKKAKVDATPPVKKPNPAKKENEDDGF